MGFLQGYVDRAITVRPEDSAVALAAAEVERLQRLVAVFRTAAAHPRRLGGEAWPEELALDKKRAKRLAHAAEHVLRDWGGEPVEWEEASKVAATLNFESWWHDHEAWLRARQCYVATWCQRYGDNNGDLRWGKSAIVRFNNELKYLSYAMRES